MNSSISTLNNMFGIPCSLRKSDIPESLPYFYSFGRQYYIVDMAGSSFLLVSLFEEEKFGAVAYKKQLGILMEKSGLNVAFSFPAITRKQRDALISQEIPFIALPDQIYLPFLGISLSDCFRAKAEVFTDRLTPAAQCLYLYFLYDVKINNILKKQAAAALHFSRMTITRASAQLAALNLITEEKLGTEVHMRATAVGREYLDMAENVLINPVQKTVIVEQTEDLLLLPTAGETALSERSMLGFPKIPIKAMQKSSPDTESLKEVDPLWEEAGPLLQIELWKYDPQLFSRDNLVDPVSMMLSLQDIHDERLEGELEEYMEGLQW